MCPKVVRQVLPLEVNIYCHVTSAITTGITFFVQCLRHPAKAMLHSTKPLLSVTLDKQFIGKWFFAEYFFWTLDKDFAECRKALGKGKHSTN
jgi:hypothetical protein